MFLRHRGNLSVNYDMCWCCFMDVSIFLRLRGSVAPCETPPLASMANIPNVPCKGALRLAVSEQGSQPSQVFCVVYIRLLTWVCDCLLAGIVGSYRTGDMYVCLVSVVCCQVEVSATGWSLVQSCRTGCGGVSECDCEATIMRRPRPTGDSRGGYALFAYAFLCYKWTYVR